METLGKLQELKKDLTGNLEILKEERGQNDTVIKQYEQVSELIQVKFGVQF